MEFSSKLLKAVKISINQDLYVHVFKKLEILKRMAPKNINYFTLSFYIMNLFLNAVYSLSSLMA